MQFNNGGKSIADEPPISQSTEAGGANNTEDDQGQSGEPAVPASDNRNLNQPDERGEVAKARAEIEGRGGEQPRSPHSGSTSTEKVSDGDEDIEVLKTVMKLPVPRVIVVKPDGSLPLSKYSVGTVRDSLQKVDRLLELNAKERVNLTKWKADLLVKLKVGQLFNKDASLFQEGSRFTPAGKEVVFEKTANGVLLIRNQQGRDGKTYETKQMPKPKDILIQHQALDKARGDAAKQNVNVVSHLGAAVPGGRFLLPKPPPPPPPPKPKRSQTVSKQEFIPFPKLTKAPTASPPSTSPKGNNPVMQSRAREAVSTSEEKNGRVVGIVTQFHNLLSKPVPSKAASSPGTLQPRPPIPPPRTKVTKQPKKIIAQTQQNSNLYPPPGGFSKSHPDQMTGLKWTYPPATGFNMQGSQGEAGSPLVSPKRRRASGGTGHSIIVTSTTPSTCQASCGSTRPNKQKATVRHLCDYCFEKDGIFVCSGCSNRHYCSSACQQGDWEFHSLHCSA